ncbi:carbon-nitrogen hydrolase family protein [Allorhizobium borbori]|uniref:Putative amidohydrolase n=1 Tax=Allorhizobium borbori TaxID=485907 RepID=A0A7W6JZ07_9HYPH|nr:carbon-nitrogen hydrolase family protein [Allorhizobium borbori]MBB4102160.1 putative amidohydrolase [Allorhizobium borbori]
MRVALYQMQATPGAVADNLARIEQAVFAASIMGAALLVTPEMSVTGYALGAETASFAEPADGPILARLEAMAAARNIAVVAGFPERLGDAIYNSAALVRPDGTIEVYRKCHLYGALEREAFRASDTPPAVFQIGGLKAAMVICYDVEFPEFVRSAALAGAELLIVPTALAASEANRMIPDRIVPARALENQMFVIYADLCGSDGVLDYEGHSVICSPDGAHLARAGRGEALITVDLDRNLYASSMAELPYLAERRPELYGAVVGKRV